MLPWRLPLPIACDLASSDISKNDGVSHLVRYGEFLFSDAMLNATFILATFLKHFSHRLRKMKHLHLANRKD